MVKQTSPRVVIIGGSGHVGTYLAPRLVAAGHEVVAVSRGQREPYQAHGAWAVVEQHTIDRTVAEAAGTFGAQIRELRPDAVIDRRRGQAMARATVPRSSMRARFALATAQQIGFAVYEWPWKNVRASRGAPRNAS